jgi:SSS family solute:Na+ symporter
MELYTIDWLIIILFFIITLGIGVFFTQKAGKNIESFFLGGRNLPLLLIRRC